MKENDNDINNMHELANEGWRQMHEMLRKRGFSEDAAVLPAAKKMRWYPLLAASALLILIFSFPYILNDRRHSSLNSSAIKPLAPSTPNKPVTVTQSVKMISRIPGSILLSQQKNEASLKSEIVFVNTKKQSFTISILPQGRDHLEELSSESIAVPSNLPAQSNSVLKDSANADISAGNKKKTKDRVAKKVQFFAGAGINISAWNRDPLSFGLRDFNIHPGIAIIIPVAPKLNLHTGLWAFSTVHGKDASSKERQLVNSVSSNIYYNVNTTSIIKASYFDIPVTLHYSLNKKWSVGSGLQVSKLYKMSIRELQESFDYNDNRFATTVQQYSSTPTQAANVLRRKVEIKNFEPRFVAEANFQQKRWLLSAGYYYGLGKTITLKDADNTRHEYRNEYLKLGIQYQIGGK